jgi:MFS family permease
VWTNDDPLQIVEWARAVGCVHRAPTTRMRISLRYVICCHVIYVLFANHWARDSVGALELPLEQDPEFALLPSEYNLLNSVYFLPNCVVPIFAGMMAQRNGVSKTYVQFLAVLLIGNVLVAFGSMLSNVSDPFPLLLTGRMLQGFAYEAVDCLPIGLLSPLFEREWATVTGIINGANRLGSIANFLLMPLTYHAAGLRYALLLSSAVGASAMLSGLAVRHAAARLSRTSDAPEEANTSTSEAAAPATAPSTSSATLSLASMKRLGVVFWLYVLASACVYGSVVPFWFIGSKHIVLTWNVSLADADVLLLLPEGLIGVLAPPYGMLIDRMGWTLPTRLLAAAAALSLVPIALTSLAWFRTVPPTPMVTLLGVGYALSQTMVWANILLIVPACLLNVATGLLASALNLLPALLPALVFSGADSSRDLTVLAAVGVVGVLAFALTAVAVRQSRGADGHKPTIATPARSLATADTAKRSGSTSSESATTELFASHDSRVDPDAWSCVVPAEPSTAVPSRS